MIKRMKKNQGQILVEILISAVIFIFVSLGTAYISSTALRSIPGSSTGIVSAFLVREEADTLKAIARENWHNIDARATTSANRYYTFASGTQWAVSTSTGSSTIVKNGISYVRSFYLDSVYRSSSVSGDGNITTSSESGAVLDPSTRKVTVEVAWVNTLGISEKITQVFYLSRYLNKTFGQSGWSGGAVADQVVTTPGTTFSASSNVVATTSIVLSQVGSGGDEGGPPTDYVAYWKFDEGSGISVADQSSNGNNGSLSASNKWVAGKVGNAVDFDTVSMTVANHSSLQITGDMTISFVWKNTKNPEGSGGTYPILKGAFSSDINEFRIDLSAGDGVGYTPIDRWALLGVSLTEIGYVNWLTPAGGNSGLQWNDWYLVTIVKSASGGLYENQTQIYSGGTATALSSSEQFNIFPFNFGESVIIDELRIYNRALTETEIGEIYNSIF